MIEEAIKGQGHVLKTVHSVRVNAYRFGDHYRADTLVIIIMSIVNNIVNNIMAKAASPILKANVRCLVLWTVCRQMT